MTDRVSQNKADVVIVGAEIAGCAAAVAFGKQGRKVLLLEKSLAEPDRAVGELLHPGGVRTLNALGLGVESTRVLPVLLCFRNANFVVISARYVDCLEDIDSVPCHGYRVSCHKEPVNISYPESPGTPGVRPEDRSFHNGRFVRNLRRAAADMPNVTVVEARVIDVLRDEPTGKIVGVVASSPRSEKPAKQSYFVSLTIISDGYASTFHKAYLPNKPSSRSKSWALELIDAQLPRPYYGHVILSEAPPVILYQISQRETRIFMDVPTALPSASPATGGIKGHMLNVVLPELPPGCQQSFREAVSRGRFRSMPNSFLHRFRKCRGSCLSAMP